MSFVCVVNYVVDKCMHNGNLVGNFLGDFLRTSFEQRIVQAVKPAEFKSQWFREKVFEVVAQEEITIPQLATRIDISKQHLYKVLGGKKVSDELLEVFCKMFKLPFPTEVTINSQPNPMQQVDQLELRLELLERFVVSLSKQLEDTLKKYGEKRVN
jgi:hypothetical protein